MMIQCSNVGLNCLQGLNILPCRLPGNTGPFCMTMMTETRTQQE